MTKDMKLVNYVQDIIIKVMYLITLKLSYTKNIIYIGLEEVNSFNIGESIHL